MKSFSKMLLSSLTCCALTAVSASAGIIDATGDFLATYTGPLSASVDITAADVIYNPAANTFTFSGTMAGPISSAPAGTLYVFGLNRGAGTARFTSGTPSIGPGVLFDEVLILRPDGSLTINDFINPATNQATGATILGSTISTNLAASLFPSTGFAPGAYTFNLWPRVGSGNNAQVSDFAPNNSNAAVTVSPEPGTALTLAIGTLGLAAVAIRRGRTA